MDRTSHAEAVTSDGIEASLEWTSQDAPSAPVTCTAPASYVLREMDRYLAWINAACLLLRQVAPEAGSDDDDDGRGELVSYLAERIQYAVEDIHRDCLNVRRALSAQNRGQTIAAIIGSDAAEAAGRIIAFTTNGIGVALDLLHDVANHDDAKESPLSVRVLYLIGGVHEHLNYIEEDLLPAFFGNDKPIASTSRSVH